MADSMTSAALAAPAAPDTLNAHWKNNKSGFGFRMLQKMGWKEDKGLGKDESGITAHIKAKRREEGLGLGSNTSNDAGSAGWSKTAAGFNDVLSVLKQSYKTKEKKKKSSKKIPDISVGMK
jgi:Pin2-interacting protein X1